MKEALFYRPTGDGSVQCELCPHYCAINDNKRGICGVRENRNGKLYTLVYGKAIAEHADPIEKKPLFHFHPGSYAYSIATAGCNFKCLHCQNSEISQMPREQHIILGRDISPEDVVKNAQSKGCLSISYTYTEPTIYFEYALETAKTAKQNGLKNNFITNGYINEKPLEMIAPFLDAANIDLKSFSDDFYTKICGAKLQPVLDSVVNYIKHGIWIEITTLLIPGLNDSDKELENIASFIAGISVEIPWHVSAFYPTYKMTDKKRASAELLLKARETGIRAGLKYVYTGNIPGCKGESTYCYKCGKTLIERSGFTVTANQIRNNSCPDCNTIIEGVGMDSLHR